MVLMLLGLTFLREQSAWGSSTFQDLIPTNIFQSLANAAWPMNFDGSGRRLGAQTEMHAFVARRKIAARRRHGRPLSALRGDQLSLPLRSRRGCCGARRVPASTSDSDFASRCAAHAGRHHLWSRQRPIARHYQCRRWPVRAPPMLSGKPLRLARKRPQNPCRYFLPTASALCIEDPET